MMRLKSAGLLASSLLLATATQVQAQEGWRVGVHGGQTEVDRLVQDSGLWWNDLDDDAFTYGASLGYDFSRNLGMRVMYERTNSLSGTNVCPTDAICPAIVLKESEEAQLWSAALLPRMYLTDDLSVFGSIGASHVEVDSGDTLPGDDDTELSYGAGISWEPAERLRVGLEYQRSEFEHDTLRVNFGWRL